MACEAVVSEAHHLVRSHVRCSSFKADGRVCRKSEHWRGSVHPTAGRILTESGSSVYILHRVDPIVKVSSLDNVRMTLGNQTKGLLFCDDG